ncbi:MAG: hypothetical protein V8S71_09115 [Oscillospiraceae bacterium]
MNSSIGDIQVICTMGPGEVTDSGHYIVLLHMNENGAVAIDKPNSPKNSQKSWKLERLMEQMENLWAYSLSD